MHDSFAARNELEEKLTDAQENRLPESEFMQYLQEAQVFMPVRDSIGIEGFTGSSKAIPLTIKTEDEVEVLILFTSPERSKTFLQDYPGYDGGLLVEFKWVLEKTGSGVGISINPDWPVGIDMEPEMVQRLKHN